MKSNRQSYQGDALDSYKPPMSVGKNHLKITIPKRYDAWFESEKQEYTAAGNNPRSAPLDSN